MTNHMGVDREHQIRGYIVENFLLGQEGGPSDDDSLLESGVVDSTGVMHIVAFLERTFGIELSDEDLVPKNLDTIRSVVGFVDRKLSARGAGREGTRECPPLLRVHDAGLALGV